MSAAGGIARSFADMPLVLKGITSFFAAFGAGSLLLALAPGVEHRVAGEVLTRAELWESGLGPFALGLGAWLLASAVGLLRRARWGCWGVVLAYAPFAAGGPASQGLLAALWAAGTALYLFRTRGATRFFAPDAGVPLED